MIVCLFRNCLFIMKVMLFLIWSNIKYILLVLNYLGYKLKEKNFVWLISYCIVKILFFWVLSYVFVVILCNLVFVCGLLVMVVLFSG